MGRRHLPSTGSAPNEAEEKNDTQEESPIETSPALPGGTPGIDGGPNQHNVVSSTAFKSPTAEQLEEAGVKAEVFQTVNGGRVVQGGIPTTIRPNAIVSVATHDLDNLRRQGIQLKPYDPNPPAAAK